MAKLGETMTKNSLGKMLGLEYLRTQNPTFEYKPRFARFLGHTDEVFHVLFDNMPPSPTSKNTPTLVGAIKFR